MTINKLFLSIATSAVCLTGIVSQAQAAPGWVQPLVSRSCSLMAEGYHPRKAGEKAAMAVLRGPHAGELYAAIQDDTFQQYLEPALARTCRSTVIKAVQIHSL